MNVNLGVQASAYKTVRNTPSFAIVSATANSAPTPIAFVDPFAPNFHKNEIEFASEDSWRGTSQMSQDGLYIHVIITSSRIKEIYVPSMQSRIIEVTGVSVSQRLTYNPYDGFIYAISNRDVLKINRLTGVGTSASLVLGASAGGVNDLRVTNNGTILVVATQGIPYLQRVNLSTLTLASNFSSLPEGAVRQIALNHDESRLAVAQQTSTSTSLRVYNTSSSSLVATPSIGTGVVNSVAYNHDGTKLAAVHSQSPYVTVLETSGYTNLNYNNLVSILTQSGNSVGFLHTTDNIVVCPGANTTRPVLLRGGNNGNTLSEVTSYADTPHIVAAHKNIDWVGYADRNAAGKDLKQVEYKSNTYRLTQANYNIDTTTDHAMVAISRKLNILVRAGASNRLDIFDLHTGRKLTSPVSLPASVVRGMAFSPDSTRLVLALEGSPYIMIYNTTDWSVVTNPTTLPTGTANGVAYSANGSWVAIAHNTAPFVTQYNTSNWSKISNPSVALAGNGNKVDYSPNNSWLAITHSVSPFLRILTAGGTSTSATPGTNPATTGIKVEFDKNNSSKLYIARSTTIPSLFVYNTGGWTVNTASDSVFTYQLDAFATSKDGNYLLSCMGTTGQTKALYNTSNWTLVANQTDLSNRSITSAIRNVFFL